MKDNKVLKWIVGAFNVLGIACLCYFASLLISRDTTVLYPDAMLPMQTWERGGSALVIGLIPLVVVNILAFILLWKDKIKMPARLLFFLPGAVCAFFVVVFILMSFTDSSNESSPGKEIAVAQIYSINDGKLYWEVLHDTGYEERISYDKFKDEYEGRLGAKAEIIAPETNFFSSQIIDGTVITKAIPASVDSCPDISLEDKTTAEGIIEGIASLENHDIIATRFIKTDSLWFAEVQLNVNIWDPYDLFVYYPDKKTAERICTWDNCEVESLYLLAD